MKKRLGILALCLLSCAAVIKAGYDIDAPEKKELAVALKNFYYNYLTTAREKDSTWEHIKKFGPTWGRDIFQKTAHQCLIAKEALVAIGSYWLIKKLFCKHSCASKAKNSHKTSRHQE